MTNLLQAWCNVRISLVYTKEVEALEIIQQQSRNITRCRLTFWEIWRFGESLMLDIIAACKGTARSSITLETYYKANKKEKAVWADKYKNNIVARLMLLNCNDRVALYLRLQ